MKEYNELENIKFELQTKINNKKCVCYCSKCGDLLHKIFPFCYELNEEGIETKKKEIEDHLDKAKIYNPLYIITFKNKKDYENVYKKYPHSSYCRKDKNSLYINKSPNPEDVAWENLEFQKECLCSCRKMKIFGTIFYFFLYLF